MNSEHCCEIRRMFGLNFLGEGFKVEIQTPLFVPGALLCISHIPLNFLFRPPPIVAQWMNLGAMSFVECGKSFTMSLILSFDCFGNFALRPFQSPSFGLYISLLAVILNLYIIFYGKIAGQIVRTVGYCDRAYRFTTAGFTTFTCPI